MSPDDVERVEALMAGLDGDLVEIFADPARVDALRAAGEPFADPDLETTFHGPTAEVGAGPFRGFDGLVAGWREWLSTFASYRIRVEDVFQEGDRVVVLVRQKGRTIHGGVDVPSPPSAAVFTMRDGRLTRLRFYLHRVDAAKAEGFELP